MSPPAAGAIEEGLTRMADELGASGDRCAEEARLLRSVAAALRAARQRPDLPGLLATFALHVEAAERRVERIVEGRTVS